MSSVSSKSFDDLPLEIQLQICSYLTKWELRTCLAPVCRSWYELSWLPNCWKDLRLSSNCDIGTKCIFDCISKLNSFTLFISEERNTTICLESILEHLCKCTTLLDIDVSRCNDLTCEQLSRLVRSCPIVRSLTVSNCNWVNDERLAVVSQWTELSDVHASDCDELSDNGIAKMVENCLKLKAISLEGSDSVTDDAVSQLIDSRNNTLEYLALKKFHLMPSLFESITTCNRLVSLIVDNAGQMIDSDLLKIKNLTNLKHLKLNSGRSLSVVAFKKLFVNGSLKNLVFLDLTDCEKLGNSGVIEITRNCRQLKHLNLKNCSVGSAGVRSILDHCRDLRILYLSGQWFQYSCFEVDPFPLTKLLYLEMFGGFKKSNDVVTQLSIRNPQLEIFDVFDNTMVKCGVMRSRENAKKFSVVRQGCRVVVREGSHEV